MKSLPTHGLSPVLLVQPFLKWREIFEDSSRIHLALSGKGLECVRPRAARAHLQHSVQSPPGFLAAVDRAPMKRRRAAGGLCQSSVKLKLQDVRKKISHVGHIGGHVKLGSRIEVALASSAGRGNALVL